SETDYRLPRPVHANDFAVILRAIESGASMPELPARAAEPEPAAPAIETRELPPVAAGDAAAPDKPAPAEPPAPEPIPEPEPEPEPEPAIELPPDRPLAQWLAGGLERRVRLQR